MGARYMDYPSPRGVHVPETYYSSLDPDDPYRRPPLHQNRYSRSTHQTPPVRKATWISSPDPQTPQTPHVPSTPWLAPQAPQSPARRPPSAVPPSPAPTVGEHMTVDELAFTQDDLVDPYHMNQPIRPSILKSFWKGLKKLSGFQSGPSFPIPRPYESQKMEMPMPMSMPMPSAPSEATQYVDPTPPETAGTGTEEHRSTTPHASPYARRVSINATPAAIPGSWRASPVPSMEVPPPITVVSPSSPSSLSTSTRSARVATPGPVRQNLPVSMPEPAPPSVEQGSQTLHEHTYADPNLPPLDLPLTSAIAVPASPTGKLKFPLPPSGSGMPAMVVDRSSSKGSLASTMARFRQFVTDLDGLPWISDSQIADEYIPERNPRSRLRAKVRQGADPSWYNPRPETVERPEYWSEWDTWAKQSTAGLWDGTTGGRVGWAGVGAGGGPVQGQWGMVYPQGYVPAPAQPIVYPSGYPPPGMVND